MISPVLDEISVLAQDCRHVETCPRCDGVVTDDDMVIVDGLDGRTAWLACPHCGHEVAKTFPWKNAPATERPPAVCVCAAMCADAA